MPDVINLLSSSDEEEPAVQVSRRAASAAAATAEGRVAVHRAAPKRRHGGTPAVDLSADSVEDAQAPQHPPRPHTHLLPPSLRDVRSVRPKG